MKESRFEQVLFKAKQLMVVIMWVPPHCLPLQCHYGLSRDCTFASTGWRLFYNNKCVFFRSLWLWKKQKSRHLVLKGVTVYPKKTPNIYTISKPSRTIWLKICMQLENQILRTISRWHFFEIFVYVSPPPPKGVNFPQFCTYESNSQNWWIWAYSRRGQLLTGAFQ